MSKNRLLIATIILEIVLIAQLWVGENPFVRNFSTACAIGIGISLLIEIYKSINNKHNEKN